MKAFALRWFSFDDRTLGLFLGVGVSTMAFFRLGTLRDKLGVAQGPELSLALVLVAVALAWWSLLPRGFVWLDPAVLTWRDFVGDRTTVIARRLAGGWLVRQALVGYLLAVVVAIVAAPAEWAFAGAAVLVGAGALALSVVRRPRTALWPEAAVVVGLATFAVVVRPGPVPLYVLAVGCAAAAVVVFPGERVTQAGRQTLVDGWRDRVLRVSGLQFLDLALLLPAARPVRPRPLGTGLRLAWLGVLGRSRHAPTAVLLGLTAVATHLAFPRLPAVLVFTALGYLATVPLMAGLGELWRSPGRRRWVGLSDTALRWHHLVVATGLAAGWGLAVCWLADLPATVLVLVPVVSSCTVRTMTRKPPSFGNLVQVDTPFGALPTRLVLQTLRGPDLGVVALVLAPALPLWGAGLVAAAVVAVALFR
jgi:hypothetical protein